MVFGPFPGLLFGISFLLTYSFSTVPLFKLLLLFYFFGYGDLDLDVSDLMPIPFFFRYSLFDVIQAFLF
jgi:hypothetical protein